MLVVVLLDTAEAFLPHWKCVSGQQKCPRIMVHTGLLFLYLNSQTVLLSQRKPLKNPLKCLSPVVHFFHVSFVVVFRICDVRQFVIREGESQAGLATVLPHAYSNLRRVSHTQQSSYPTRSLMFTNWRLQIGGLTSMRNPEPYPLLSGFPETQPRDLSVFSCTSRNKPFTQTLVVRYYSLSQT